MMAMARRIRARLRVEGPSWLAHSVIATAFTVGFDPLLGPWESWRLAVWGYTFREGEQLGRAWLRLWRAWGRATEDRSLPSLWWRLKTTTWEWHHSANWIGSGGDVAAPALVAWLVVLRWLL